MYSEATAITITLQIGNKRQFAINSEWFVRTCEWIREKLSVNCIRLGTMIRIAGAFEQSIQWDTFIGGFVAAFLAFGSPFDALTEFNDCKLEVVIKPGGGSTPSAISMARCKRAFLSQSSIEYSSGVILKRVQQRKCVKTKENAWLSMFNIYHACSCWSIVTTMTFPPLLNSVDLSNSNVVGCCPETLIVWFTLCSEIPPECSTPVDCVDDDATFKNITINRSILTTLWFVEYDLIQFSKFVPNIAI